MFDDYHYLFMFNNIIFNLTWIFQSLPLLFAIVNFQRCIKHSSVFVNFYVTAYWKGWIAIKFVVVNQYNSFLSLLCHIDFIHTFLIQKILLLYPEFSNVATSSYKIAIFHNYYYYIIYTNYYINILILYYKPKIQ